jgi:hypothetical protein
MMKLKEFVFKREIIVYGTDEEDAKDEFQRSLSEGIWDDCYDISSWECRETGKEEEE